MNARVVAISKSKEKGKRKDNVKQALLKEGFGIVGDAHAGSLRQVSLLTEEAIEKIKEKGLDVEPGDFAENITTQGIDLLKLEIGTKLKIGKTAILEISQIGKACHVKCDIYFKIGECVMPKEGIFTRVLKGGIVKRGDKIYV